MLSVVVRPPPPARVSGPLQRSRVPAPPPASSTAMADRAALHICAVSPGPMHTQFTGSSASLYGLLCSQPYTRTLVSHSFHWVQPDYCIKHWTPAKRICEMGVKTRRIQMGKVIQREGNACVLEQHWLNVYTLWLLFVKWLVTLWPLINTEFRPKEHIYLFSKYLNVSDTEL